MKKILALVLAVMLVVGMAPMAFAANYASVTISVLGQSVSATTSVSETFFGTFKAGSVPDPYAIKDGATKNRYPMFDAAGVALTRKDVRTDKLTVQKQSTLQGAKVVKNVKIGFMNVPSDNNSDNDIAFIEVEYFDTLLSTGSVDYGATIYLMQDKTRIAGWKFSGTFENFSQEVDATYDYIYTYDYPVIDCKEYIKSTRIDAGNGIIINAKLFEGKKYYARASSSIRSEDDSVLTEYPEIDTIYYLDTLNLSGSGNTVSLESNDKSLFVYNKDLEFVGMGNEPLAFSSKYYISSVELDVEDADADEGPDGPTEAANPDMGGDDVPANVNDNPGTGR